MTIYVQVNAENKVIGYATNAQNNFIQVETDIDIETVDIVCNYKLENGKIIPMTEEEIKAWEDSQPKQELTELEKIQERLRQTEEAFGVLSLQVAKNTLLQNEGMR